MAFTGTADVRLALHDAFVVLAPIPLHVHVVVAPTAGKAIVAGSRLPAVQSVSDQKLVSEEIYAFPFAVPQEPLIGVGAIRLALQSVSVPAPNHGHIHVVIDP